MIKAIILMMCSLLAILAMSEQYKDNKDEAILILWLYSSLLAISNLL